MDNDQPQLIMNMKFIKFYKEDMAFQKYMNFQKNQNIIY